MCLILRSHSKEQFAPRTNIRYRVVRLSSSLLKYKNGRDYHTKQFVSKYVSPFRLKNLKQGWNTDTHPRTGKIDATEFGFHVFVNKEDAEYTMNYLNAGYLDPVMVIKKVEVKGFLRSGTWDKMRSETWKQFRFLKD